MISWDSINPPFSSQRTSFSPHQKGPPFLPAFDERIHKGLMADWARGSGEENLGAPASNLPSPEGGGAMKDLPATGSITINMFPSAFHKNAHRKAQRVQNTLDLRFLRWPLPKGSLLDIECPSPTIFLIFAKYL